MTNDNPTLGEISRRLDVAEARLADTYARSQVDAAFAARDASIDDLQTRANVAQATANTALNVAATTYSPSKES